MKPEMKLEGDKLLMKVAESKVVDTDGDGQAAAKVSLALEVEVDGSEVLQELMKSSTLAQKAHEMLVKMGVAKAEVVAP